MHPTVMHEEAWGVIGYLGLGVATLDFCFGTDLLFSMHACKPNVNNAGCHPDMFACVTDIT